MIASNLMHSLFCKELCKIGKPLRTVIAILEMNNRHASQILCLLYASNIQQQIHNLSTFGIKLIMEMFEIVYTV